MDTFWKQKERRVLREWFGLERIGGTGRACPDGRGENIAVEVFTYPIPRKLLDELRQAEHDLRNCDNPNEFIPWGVFGPWGGRDLDMIVFTKLKYFSRRKETDEEVNHRSTTARG